MKKALVPGVYSLRPQRDADPNSGADVFPFNDSGRMRKSTYSDAER
jgi:hypothetical protein